MPVEGGGEHQVVDDRRRRRRGRRAPWSPRRTSPVRGVDGDDLRRRTGRARRRSRRSRRARASTGASTDGDVDHAVGRRRRRDDAAEGARGRPGSGRSSSVRSSFSWWPTGVDHRSSPVVRIETDHDGALAGRDHDGVTVGRASDQRVHQVAVEEVVRMDLVVPAQLAGVDVEGDRRVGVEVGAGTARAVGELGGARERRRVGHAPDTRRPSRCRWPAGTRPRRRS